MTLPHAPDRRGGSPLLPLLPLLLLSLSLPWIAACGDSRAVDPGPPAAGEIGAACVTDADCTSDYCLLDPSFPGGYCIQLCDTDPSCPQGATCHDYLSYQFCLDQCAADTDCRDSYVCTYGVCRPPCGNSLACRKGDTCLSGQCKAKCTANTDCPAGERCQDGKCIPPCKADTECLPGFACDKVSGVCKAKTGKSMGEACSSDGQCATGHCLPTRKICSITCGGSADCPSGYVCGLETIDKDKNGSFDDVEAACVPVQGKGAAGAVCTADASCASGHCYYGFCMEGCTADASCASTQRCADVNILLTGAIPAYKGCLPKSGNGAVFPLGTIPTSSASFHGFDVPSQAGSFVLTTEMNTLTEAPYVTQLKDPKGNTVTQIGDSCSQFSQPNRYSPAEQFSTLLVPNTTSVSIVPGVYTYVVGSTNQQPVTVKLQLKLGVAQKGTLNLNWFFLNLAGTCIPAPTLKAAGAASHAWLGKLRNNLITILKTAGLTVGSEKFYDVADPALDVLDLSMTSLSTELQKLFSKSKSISGRSVNIFFVRDIKAGGMTGGTVLGIAGGIPGPPAKHGTVHSGVAMSMKTACYEYMGYNPAHTLAHEIGHYLGLSHNQENTTVPGISDGKVVCACPCGANLSCVTQSGQSWCRGEDHLPDTTTSEKNLMYYAAESTQMFDGNQLTPGQIRVMLNNPVVGF